MLCPICRLVDLTDSGPDALDQSGYSYLPAQRWTCPKCLEARGERTVVVIATGEPYRVYGQKENLPC